MKRVTRRTNTFRSRQSGFTLTELMITVAIIAIASAVALSTRKGLAGRAESYALQIYYEFNRARNAATGGRRYCVFVPLFTPRPLHHFIRILRPVEGRPQGSFGR